jgi:exodeoxyribonuclease-3
MPKIVSLNIQHGGGKRQPALSRWLIDTMADFLVLPEWRSGSELLARELSAAGYVGNTLVRPGRSANGVAIFSRAAYPADRVTPEDALKGELLHLRTEQLDLVGVYFPQMDAKASFFRRCSSLADEATQPLLILGDLNTGSNTRDIEAGASRFRCEKEFMDISDSHGLSDLWRLQHGLAAREWTWQSSSNNGFRIDHAFANQRFTAAFPQWQCMYDHSPREQKFTDHSALIVEI